MKRQTVREKPRTVSEWAVIVSEKEETVSVSQTVRENLRTVSEPVAIVSEKAETVSEPPNCQ